MKSRQVRLTVGHEALRHILGSGNLHSHYEGYLFRGLNQKEQTHAVTYQINPKAKVVCMKCSVFDSAAELVLMTVLQQCLRSFSFLMIGHS